MTPEQCQEVAEVAALLIARPERRELLLSAFPLGAREVLRDLLEVLSSLLDGTTDAETVRTATGMLADLWDVRTAVDRGAVGYLAGHGGERDG